MRLLSPLRLSYRFAFIVENSTNILLLLAAPGTDADVSEFIGVRLRTVNADPSAPPYDSVREYAYEGAGSAAGSLSSVASTDQSVSDVENEQWDELSNWGPRFHKLADVYGLK
jgi:Cadherin cytoplasmic region